MLTKGSQRITLLVPGPDSDLGKPAQSVLGAYTAPMTAVQATKAVARVCCADLAVPNVAKTTNAR